MTSHLDNRGHPTIWLKTAPKRPKTALFLVFVVGAPWVLAWDVISLAGIVAQTQNYNSTVRGLF